MKRDLADTADSIPSRGRSRLAFGLILVAALAAAAWWWFFVHSREAAPASAVGIESGSKAGRKGGFDPSRPTPVGVAAARAANLNVYLNALGTITPLRTVTVRSRVDGQLLCATFTEGQLVKEGELLAEIDPRPFQVQLMQAQGQLAKDQALLANARVDLERYKTLFAQDSIARQQLDTQDSLVRQYDASIKLDQAQIESARLNLTYAKITAPITGRIGLRQVDPGNIVHAADTNGLAVITQLQPVSAIFPIPQDSLPQVMKRLRGGEKLTAEAWDRDQKSKLATGALLTFDNQIDPQTGTVKLKAEFPNAQLELFPNQFVNIRLLLDVVKDAIVVPAAALQRGTQGTFLFVVKDDKTVSLRQVEAGPVEGLQISVTKGLAAGERVVVEGTDRLREGARIEVPADGGARSAGAEGKGTVAGASARPVDPARAELWRNAGEAEKQQQREDRRRQRAAE